MNSSQSFFHGGLVAAFNDGTKKISENMSNQLGSISGGMGLPPGMKLPF